MKYGVFEIKSAKEILSIIRQENLHMLQLEVLDYIDFWLAS